MSNNRTDYPLKGLLVALKKTEPDQLVSDCWHQWLSWNILYGAGQEGARRICKGGK